MIGGMELAARTCDCGVPMASIWLLVLIGVVLVLSTPLARWVLRRHGVREAPPDDVQTEAVVDR
jgi:hypothetical protein